MVIPKSGRKMELSLWDVMKWGWSLVLPHNWYLHKKLDRLQEEHVRREEFNGTVNSLRVSMEDARREVNQRLDSILHIMADKK